MTQWRTSLVAAFCCKVLHLIASPPSDKFVRLPDYGAPCLERSRWRIDGHAVLVVPQGLKVHPLPHLLKPTCHFRRQSPFPACDC